MRTMSREPRVRKPRIVHLKPGDHYTLNDVNYVVPSKQMIQDIEEFESNKDTLKFNNLDDLFDYLDD